MDIKFVPIIIATIISVFSGITTYLISRRKLRIDQKKLYQDFYSKYSEKIVDLRLQHYGEALEISDRIYQKKAPELINSQAELRAIARDLQSWRRGVVGLILSPKSLIAFRELTNHMTKNHGNGSNFTERQVEKIWNARINFRASLRLDIWNIINEGEINSNDW